MISATLPTRILRSLSDGRPQLGVPCWKLKVGWHYPDHRETAAIKGQSLIEHAGVGAESPASYLDCIATRW